MGLVCQLIFQPIIKLIQVVVSVVEFILVRLCQIIQEIVSVVTQIIEYLCTSVIRTVCGAVCGVVCGICGLICGIFGCDCHCDRICKSVCTVVTDVVCGWTYVLTTVLQAVTVIVCSYILQAVTLLLNVIEAIVTMVLTWVCSLIDIFIRWFLCWTYLADLFNNTRPRCFRVAPKVIPNDEGYSDWFVYVNNASAHQTVEQEVKGYVLSDQGVPLVPVADPESGTVAYYEVETRGDIITGALKRQGGGDGEYVRGEPLLYYPYKVIEIASHLFGDIFATDPADDGRGTDFHKNLFTYSPGAQTHLADVGALVTNTYNAWPSKYTSPGSPNYFGDMSISDMGMRVDTDATCSHPTNTFLHLVHSEISFTPPETDLAENMTCGAGQTLTFDQTNFLMLNKDDDGAAVTTYFVSKYNMDDSSVGCNFLLGYTIVTFEGSGRPIFVTMKVLPFDPDRSRMMARIVQNVSVNTAEIVRVAETYLHECGHQCGLLHDTDAPDCENDTTLHIAKVMNPDARVRRAYTRLQWCMVRGSGYVTSRRLSPFTQAPELPESTDAPSSDEAS